MGWMMPGKEEVVSRTANRTGWRWLILQPSIGSSLTKTLAGGHTFFMNLAVPMDNSMLHMQHRIVHTFMVPMRGVETVEAFHERRSDATKTLSIRGKTGFFPGKKLCETFYPEAPSMLALGNKCC